MSDRVAVMNNGRIEQVGTPDEVYEDPATVFVADFLGVSNLMDAEPIAWGSGECTVRIGEFSLRATCGETASRGPVKLVARPERLRLLAHGDDGAHVNCLPGIVDRTVYIGASRQVIVRLANGSVMQASITNTGADHGYAQGTPVIVEVPPDALRVLAPSVVEAAAGSNGAPAPDASAEPVPAGASG